MTCFKDWCLEAGDQASSSTCGFIGSAGSCQGRALGMALAMHVCCTTSFGHVGCGPLPCCLQLAFEPLCLHLSQGGLPGGDIQPGRGKRLGTFFFIAPGAVARHMAWTSIQCSLDEASISIRGGCLLTTAKAGPSKRASATNERPSQRELFVPSWCIFVCRSFCCGTIRGAGVAPRLAFQYGPGLLNNHRFCQQPLAKQGDASLCQLVWCVAKASASRITRGFAVTSFCPCLRQMVNNGLDDQPASVLAARIRRNLQAMGGLRECPFAGSHLSDSIAFGCLSAWWGAWQVLCVFWEQCQDEAAGQHCFSSASQLRGDGPEKRVGPASSGDFGSAAA